MKYLIAIVLATLTVAPCEAAGFRLFGRSSGGCQNGQCPQKKAAVNVNVNRNQNNQNQNRNNNNNNNQNRNNNNVSNNQLDSAVDRFNDLAFLQTALNTSPQVQQIAPVATPPIIDNSRIEELEKKFADMLKEKETLTKELNDLKNAKPVAEPPKWTPPAPPAPVVPPATETPAPSAPVAPPDSGKKIEYSIERRK